MARVVSLTFAIEGMHCASCGLLIDDVVEGLPGVDRSTTDARRGRTIVALAGGSTTPTDIIDAITRAGYQAALESA